MRFIYFMYCVVYIKHLYISNNKTEQIILIKNGIHTHTQWLDNFSLIKWLNTKEKSHSASIIVAVYSMRFSVILIFPLLKLSHFHALRNIGTKYGIIYLLFFCVTSLIRKHFARDNYFNGNITYDINGNCKTVLFSDSLSLLWNAELPYEIFTAVPFRVQPSKC